MDTGKQHLRYEVKKNSTALIVESGKNTSKKKKGKNESIINVTKFAYILI